MWDNKQIDLSNSEIFCMPACFGCSVMSLLCSLCGICPCIQNKIVKIFPLCQKNWPISSIGEKCTSIIDWKLDFDWKTGF